MQSFSHHGFGIVLAFVIGWSITPAEAATATATIKGTTDQSPISGTATLTDTPDGLKVSVQVANVTPGTHGIHIHQFGACHDAGNGAGGHCNPDGVKHGYLPKDGFTSAHAGDLGNIEIAADGTGTLEAMVHGLMVTGGKYNVAGRSIILHEKPDDFGQPTGNAGGRIGCGVIVVTSE